MAGVGTGALAGMEDHAGARRRCGCEGVPQDGWAGQFIQ